ncbi:streptavidin-V2 [Parasteatoda tepidariorum]|uniref:streptavidin-V2 n=1 Tax=Parasteatoda tepidariorum TaxID=114398 RepID=UPI001C7282B9|nr:streptavidin-V2 [Parasteatoda tepidariorum]
MKLIGAIVFILSASQAIALCTDLTGTWRNQLNSNMTIESVTGDVFTGTYHTAVESTQGAARLSSKISGMIKTVENGKLVGFNVLWNKGASLTAWVGECIVCGGREKIFTTWVLRSYQPVKKRWMTTRINQDTFWRLESAVEEANQVLQSSVRDGSVSSSGLQGKWRSNSGDSFDITEVQEQGTWKGTHNGDGQNGVVAAGRFDGNQTYTALGFIAASSNKIRGWTGHIDDPQSTVTKVLETSWLEHTFNQNCNNPRKFVNFGIDNYSRS